jgi:hypothetical protein
MSILAKESPMSSINIRRKYSKNPPPEIVGFIIKTIAEMSAQHKYVSLEDIAHRYLLFGPTVGSKEYPNPKGFISACVYIHSNGVFFVNNYGLISVVRDIDTADNLSVVSMADNAISRELDSISQTPLHLVSHAL